MFTLRFFAIRFRAHAWVRWIVRSSDGFRAAFFLYVSLICCITRYVLFCGLLGQVYVPPILYFLITFLI